jgi:hypothetical protein
MAASVIEFVYYRIIYCPVFGICVLCIDANIDYIYNHLDLRGIQLKCKWFFLFGFEKISPQFVERIFK